MDYKRYIAERLKVEGVSEEEIAESVAVPPDTEMGDYALPCFRFAKTMRKSPVQIAQELQSQYPVDGVISEVSAVNGYLNFKVDRKALARDVLARISDERERYGASATGGGKVICLDYSQNRFISDICPPRFWAARFTGFSIFSAIVRSGSIISATTGRSSANSSRPTSVGGTKNSWKRAGSAP